MDWFSNDALFIQECKTGHAWEKYVALFLRMQGLETKVLPQTIRESVADAGQYKHLSDIVCEGVLLEVKSRNVLFHTPEDFPHPTILVDTVSGWEAKNPSPKVVLCVSQQTGAMIWLPAMTKSSWIIANRFDHVRRIEDRFYESVYGLWQPVETLVQVLQQLRSQRQDQA